MTISLRYKATLLIALTQLALLAALLGSNLYQTRHNLEEEVRTHAQTSAALLAEAATDPLLALDHAQLKQLLNGVIHKHRIEYAAIYDHRGRLLVEAGSPGEPALHLDVERPVTVAGTLFGRVRVEVSRAETETAIARNTGTNLAIAALEVALVAFISLTLGWFLTRNLAALAAGTAAIGRGALHTRVSVKARDEVGALAAGFNDMAAQLERNMQELAASHQRFRDMADHTSDWVWETDAEGRYTYVSQRIEAMLGVTPESLLGTRAFDLMPAHDARRLGELFELARREQRAFYGFEYTLTRRDGGQVVLEANGQPIVNEAGALVGYRGVTRDITRRKEDESRLLYLAEHDALTGQLARQKFIDSLNEEIHRAERTRQSFAVIVLDLNDFKLINDTHGHLAGDSLLRVVAEVLAGTIAAPHDLLARLGADVFGVLARGVGAEEATALAQRLLAAVEGAALSVNATPVHLTACAGICVYPAGGTTSEAVLAHADIALSRAKAVGHNRWHVFAPSDHDADSMRQTVNWQVEIHAALELQRLRLEFQPILRLAGGPAGRYFEALVRIEDRGGRLIPATEFMAAAEYSGQIIDIDRWTLGEALRRLAEPANADVRLSLNLSGRSLSAPGLDEFLKEQLFDSGIDPARLVFEVTETVAVAEMARARSFLAVMRKLGYRFSLDDFGVGFSSFSYLKHLPVHQIKIDGSFIRHLDSSREDEIFVRAIVQVAKELGLETVAEFVETRAVLDLLADIGVDYAQGYFLGKPGPALDFPDLGLLKQPSPRLRRQRRT